MRVRVLFLCTETQLGACLLMRPRSRTEIVRDTSVSKNIEVPFSGIGSQTDSDAVPHTI